MSSFFIELFFCLQLRMLNFASAAKARSRTVTLTRPSRDEILHFSILGGFEKGFGIFVAKVEKGSKAEEVGLKRGDQILEVNGQSFEHVSHVKALEILRATTHLSITIRSNLHAFKGAAPVSLFLISEQWNLIVSFLTHFRNAEHAGQLSQAAREKVGIEQQGRQQRRRRRDDGRINVRRQLGCRIDQRREQQQQQRLPVPLQR